MNLKKLNGWQRLWLIGVVLWVVGTLVGPIVTGEFPTAGEFPTERKLEAEFERELEDLQSRGIQLSYTRLLHRRKMQDLWKEQAKVIGMLLLMCIVPPVGVYAFAWGGWRVAVWVGHGFKLKGESQ